jgi:hypothetical protein
MVVVDGLGLGTGVEEEVRRVVVWLLRVLRRPWI